MKKKSYLARFLAGAALAVTVGGLGTAAASSDDATTTEPAAGGGVACAPLEEPVKLKWGLRTGAPAYVNVWLADQLGYFADEGIEVEFVSIDTGQALPLLAGNEIHLASAGLNSGFFNAVSRGIEVRLLIANGNYAFDAPAPAGFYVRSELLDSGEVSEIADLRGRKIGLAGGEAAIGNAGGYLISLVLASGGLTLDDVEIVNVGLMDNPTAFAQGAIDATFLPGVVAPIVDEDGTARPFGDPNLVAGKAQGGTVIGRYLYEDRPEVVIALVRAVMRATPLVQGDYRQDEAIVDALVAAGFERDTVLSQAYYNFDMSLEPGEASLTEFQEIMVGLEQIESGEVIPYEDLVALDLLREGIASYEACYR